jgi:hypothetical protein
VLLAVVTALAVGGGVAALVGDPNASGSSPRPASAVTVYEADGTRAPAVDPAAAAAFAAEASTILPGYKFDAGDSWGYTDKGGASYTRLSGTAPGLGSITVQVYRHFDASELRAAELPERDDPRAGTFWVGAQDKDLTSVYFQPVSGPEVWVGDYAPTTGGPAPALADVEDLAVKIAGLPIVKSIAGGN